MTRAEARMAGWILARRCGKGWKPRVWENLGWHYSAVNGKDVELSEFHPGKHYWMSVDVKGNPQLIGEGTTPRKAIADARKKVTRWRGRIAKL